jgi:guanylate kinase
MTNTPVLIHRAEFERILAGYRPTDEVLEIAKGIKLIILTGPTCSGRNTLVDLLKATDRYHFAISDTTRPPKVRNGALEVDGVVYNFRPEQEVLDDLMTHKYLEAELIHQQQVSGCNVVEVLKAHKAGKVAIREMDPLGSVNMIQLIPTAIPIFISPPDFDVWMQRLTAREIVSPEELSRRLQTAIVAFDLALSDERYNIYLNDQLDQAVERVDNIVASGKVHRPAGHIDHVRKLRLQTLESIKSGTLAS